jgi:hypothetical protein
VHSLQKQDLINLALAAKEGFAIPASELYARSSHLVFPACSTKVAIQ